MTERVSKLASNGQKTNKGSISSSVDARVVRRKPTSVICQDLRVQVADQIHKVNQANISIDLTQNDLENNKQRSSNP